MSSFPSFFSYSDVNDGNTASVSVDTQFEARNSEKDGSHYTPFSRIQTSDKLIDGNHLNAFLRPSSRSHSNVCFGSAPTHSSSIQPPLGLSQLLPQPFPSSLNWPNPHVQSHLQNFMPANGGIPGGQVQDGARNVFERPFNSPENAEPHSAHAQFFPGFNQFQVKGNFESQLSRNSGKKKRFYKKHEQTSHSQAKNEDLAKAYEQTLIKTLKKTGDRPVLLACLGSFHPIPKTLGLKLKQFLEERPDKFVVVRHPFHHAAVTVTLVGNSDSHLFMEPTTVIPRFVECEKKVCRICWPSSVVEITGKKCPRNPSHTLIAPPLAVLSVNGVSFVKRPPPKMAMSEDGEYAQPILCPGPGRCQGAYSAEGCQEHAQCNEELVYWRYLLKCKEREEFKWSLKCFDLNTIAQELPQSPAPPEDPLTPLPTGPTPSPSPPQQDSVSSPLPSASAHPPAPGPIPSQPATDTPLLPPRVLSDDSVVVAVHGLPVIATKKDILEVFFGLPIVDEGIRFCRPDLSDSWLVDDSSFGPSPADARGTTAAERELQELDLNRFKDFSTKDPLFTVPSDYSGPISSSRSTSSLHTFKPHTLSSSSSDATLRATVVKSQAQVAPASSIPPYVDSYAERSMAKSESTTSTVSVASSSGYGGVNLAPGANSSHAHLPGGYGLGENVVLVLFENETAAAQAVLRSGQLVRGCPIECELKTRRELCSAHPRPGKLHIPVVSTLPKKYPVTQEAIRRFSVRKVGQWVDMIGLQDFCLNFQYNYINGEVLLAMTEDDLAEIGLPLGARRVVSSALRSLKLE